MSGYRVAWHVAVGATAVASLVAGGMSLGWPALLAALMVFAVGGATCGFAWVEESDRRTVTVASVALWFAMAAVLLLGLPELIGAWAMLVFFVMAVSCPALIDSLIAHRERARRVQTREQAAATTVRELEHQWNRTGWALRNRTATVTARLALVQERELILDELERRDPEALEELLVRSGWREPQDQ